MSTTGNVKISELTRRNAVKGGEVLPISYSVANDGIYESYSTTVNDIMSYMNNALGIASGQPNSITDRLNSYGGEIATLNRDFGRFVNETKIALEASQTAKAIQLSTGKIVSKTGYNVSQSIDGKAGALYLVQFAAGSVPADIAVFAKEVTHYYQTITGYESQTSTDENGNEVTVQVPIYGEASETIYEPLSIDYSKYGLPQSKYAIYLATEDVKMRVTYAGGTAEIIEVKYGLFEDMADSFLSIYGDLAKVLTETIAANRARIETLESAIDALGHAHAISLDVDDYMSVRGQKMILDNPGVAPQSTASADGKRPADLPNRVGQIWVGTDGDGVDSVWIATKAGTYAGWKKITIS